MAAVRNPSPTIRFAPASRSDTGSRIIDAAERLYRQFGYEKTAVADIARALSMSPANVYRFFRGKKAISQEVCRRLLEQAVACGSEIARRNAPAEDRLRAVVRELAHRKSERLRNDAPLHELLAAATEESWPAITEHAARLEGILATIVLDGMNRGEFRAGDAHRAGRCFYAAMLQYLHPALILDPAGRNLDETVDFCLAALRREPPMRLASTKLSSLMLEVPL